MKLIKTLMLTIGVLILLVVITVGVFLATFDANQYKQELSDLVKQQSGRDLVFAGDIGLTLYPSLGMQLGSMTLSNAQGFGSQPMLSVNRVTASVDVLSILSLKPQIAQLVMDGLSVDLQKNSQGVSNWDDLVADKAAPQDTPPPSDAQAPANTDKKPLQIAGAFGGLNITNANVSWKDAQAGAEYLIRDLSLLTGMVEPEKEFPLTLKLALSSAAQLTSEVALDAKVLFKNQHLKLSGLKLTTQARGEMIPVDTLNLVLTAELDYALDSAQVSVRGLNTQVKTRGGVLTSSDVTLAGEVGFDVNQQVLTVAVLDLVADLAGDSVPNRQMQLSVSASQLQMLLTQRRIDLENLVLMLNENRFEGFVKVMDYAQPAVSFKLNSKNLDVDKLTGWQRPQATGPEPEVVVTPSEPAPDVEIALPMQLLRGLKLDGELGLERVLAQGLSMTNVLLKVKASNGVIDLNPIQLDLYDGNFEGWVKLDARGEKPIYSVHKKLSSFYIGKFLQDFMQKDPISGVANLTVDISTRGDWLSQLKSSLDGTLSISVKDGALKGFNLRHSIDKAKASLKGEKLQDSEVKKTDFSAFSLTGSINNGVLASDDLNLQAPLLRVGGSGTIDLVKESLDYMVNSKLVGTLKGQDAGGIDDLSGLLIPVAIRGSWLAPELDVQLDDMLKKKFEAEKARISAEIAQQKAELQQKLAAEKERLKAAQEKEQAAQKAKLEKEKQLLEAEQQAKLDEQKAKLEAEKKRQQAELDAKKKAEQEKAKDKLKDKLNKLF